MLPFSRECFCVRARMYIVQHTLPKGEGTSTIYVDFQFRANVQTIIFLSHLASRPHIHFYIALFYLHLCVGEIYLSPDTHAQIIPVGWAYAQLYTHEMRGRKRKRTTTPHPRSKIGQKVEKKNSSLVGGTFFIAGDFSPSPPLFSKSYLAAL